MARQLYEIQRNPVTVRFEDQADWEVVRDGGRLESLQRELMDQRVLGWDVEGSGVRMWHGDRIIGHSFAWKQGDRLKSAYIPCRHEGSGDLFDDLTQLPPETVTAALKPVLEGPARKIGANIRFDIHMASQDGIAVAGQLTDTYIGTKLANENLRSYKLADCLRYAGVPHEPGWKRQERDYNLALARRWKMKVKELLKQAGFKYVPIDQLGRYACQDAVYEYLLGEWVEEQARGWPDVWSLEMDLIWGIIDMERTGVPVDCSVLQREADNARTVMEELEPLIWKIAGIEFDPGNDNAVRSILFDRLGLPPQGETPGSKPDKVVYRIDDDVLWTLEGVQHTFPKAAIVPLLRRWNSHQKILSTYTEGIIDLVGPDGILRPSFDQAGAGTGRLSCSAPNLQNIPVRTELGRRIRQAFVTRPGMIRWCVDYSQVELRMLTHLSQDPLLLKVYSEGLDVHHMTAIEAFGTADKVNGVDMRRVAKILNFGIPFGITEIGVQRNINKDLPDGVAPITESAAAGYLESWYRKYAGVSAWREAHIKRVEAAPGFEFRDLFGRPRRIPGLHYKNSKGIRNAARRAAVASMVQGSAAMLVKRAMVQVHKYLKSQTVCEANMVLMVHDDLQFDTAIDGMSRVIRECVRLMEQTSSLSVPIIADVDYFTDNWANKKSVPRRT